MAKFDLDMDLAKFKIGIDGSAKSYAAMRETIRLQGGGETINSRRKKRLGDKKKQEHGRFISWFFRTRLGVDAFEQEGDEFERIVAEMTEAMENALSASFNVGLTHEADMKAALLHAAEEWAEAVRDRIESGELGKNSAKTAIQKRMLIKYGRIGSKYGNPPPRGIKSGRWVEGIRGRWRQGRL